MTPFGHLIVGATLARWLRWHGVPVRTEGVLVGSVLPDIDWLAVPFASSRQMVHRMGTHSPLALGLAGLLLRRLGTGSVIAGGLSHILIDNWMGGNPPGVGWAYPFVRQRLALGPHLSWRGQSRPPTLVGYMFEIAVILFLIVVSVTWLKPGTGKPGTGFTYSRSGPSRTRSS